jgi:CRISPR-associated endonuclease Csn1
MSLTGEKAENLREHIVDPLLAAELASIAENAGSDKKAYSEKLENFTAKLGAKRVRWREVLSVIPLRDDRSGKDIKFVKADGNYCVEIFEDGTKWASEIIPTFIANQPRYVDFMKSRAYRLTTFSGRALIMRLIVNDMVRVVQGKSVEVYRVQQLSSGRVVLAHHLGSGDLTRNGFKLDGIKTSLTLSAEGLRKANAKRVFVDEIGRVLG